MVQWGNVSNGVDYSGSKDEVIKHSLSLLVPETPVAVPVPEYKPPIVPALPASLAMPASRSCMQVRYTHETNMEWTLPRFGAELLHQVCFYVDLESL